ncbi:hypothetical protein [Methylomonas fluvii]|nr:hypothetical protein [Methylomonas fluvii]
MQSQTAYQSLSQVLELAADESSDQTQRFSVAVGIGDASRQLRVLAGLLRPTPHSTQVVVCG